MGVKALTYFEPELRSPLKRGGFLTRDSRVVEHGRAKARRSFQFSSVNKSLNSDEGHAKAALFVLVAVGCLDLLRIHLPFGNANQRVRLAR